MNATKPILGVEITGIGIGLPRESLTNQQFIDRYGPIYKGEDKALVTAADIEKWTGVESRYICAHNETLADLVTTATVEAIRDASLPLDSKIGKLLLGTATSHKYRETPSTHPSVQRRITEMGYPILASDQADCACASFVNRWIDAYRHFLTGEIDNAVVAGGDTVSRMINKTNADTLMMADGAAAVFMERAGSESGLLSYYEATDGNFENQLVTEVGDTLDMRDGFELARESARAMIAGAKQVLDWAGVTLDQVKIIVPHQASSRIIEIVRKKLDINPSRLVITVNKYGNTSSGSVPMALHQAWQDGRINRGDIVLATAVGTGLTTETALVRW